MPDIRAVMESEYPDARPDHHADRHPVDLSAPLLRSGESFGALVITRLREVRPFTEKQIALLETFADQAVIAIENARLFEELQERTMELTQALERQTAVGEVLRVIASSPTDAAPVLETIARSAMQLSDSTQALLLIREGEHLVRRATVGDDAENRASSLDPRWPLTDRRDTVVAFLERRTIHVPDRSAPAHLAAFPDSRMRRAVASVGVPLIQDREAIGVLLVSRSVARGYSLAEIALVETFADQAVIAIENARLFQELEEKSRELEVASRAQVAVPGEHEPRAADAAERDHRVLRDAPGRGRRPGRRGVPARTSSGSTRPASTCWG